ncbi:MAG TPA: DinB family protein [Blastocatellia bacterium]|nr:DinB family protein [Blastocatellia bacterium]
MRTHDQSLNEMNDNRLLFEQIVSDYPEPTISHRPGEHNWSIKEILCHLADIQELVLSRVQKLLAEENPSIELYDEERENRERDHRNDDMGLAKSNFVSTREKLIAALKVAGDSAWSRTGRHPMNPDFTVEFVVNDMLDHEQLHFEQVRLITTRM